MRDPGKIGGGGRVFPSREAPRYAPVVFDLDGTLVDSAVGIAAALNETGLAREAVDATRVRGLVSRGAAHLIKESLQVSEAEIPDALLAFREIYQVDPCGPEHLFPGVERLLADLRQWGLPLAVCTNKPQALAERVLERIGLSGYFDCVIGSGPDRPEKPDPASLRETAARLNGRRPILVGDTMIDALTARAAGAPFIHAAYGYEALPDMPTDAVASNCSELASILERMLWPRS